MSDEEKCVAIAIGIGARWGDNWGRPNAILCKGDICYAATGPEDMIMRMGPDYLHDLNAMHEAEKIALADDALKFRYGQKLDGIVAEFNSTDGNEPIPTFHATASMRCDAFLLTLP